MSRALTDHRFRRQREVVVTTKRSKKELIALLAGPLGLGRDLSTRTVFFHEAAAGRLGLGITDYKCMDFIQRATEPLTAGQLAEVTGLTTGAITGVIDRLERGGFVRREKDPDDRRHVYIRFNPQSLEPYREHFESFANAWGELANRYSTEELEIIHDYLTRSIAVLEQETLRMRGVSATGEATGDAGHDGTELGGVKQGMLEIHRGATRWDVSTASGRFLYRAQLEGGASTVTAKQGHVTIRSGSGFLWRRGGGKLVLTEAIPWRIIVHGGMWRFDGKLGALTLHELSVHGGASECTIALPKPDRIVPLRVHGGVHQVKLTCPADVPLRVSIHGGAARLHLDTLELAAADGVVRWESPGFGRAERGYDLHVQGGVEEFSFLRE